LHFRQHIPHIFHAKDSMLCAATAPCNWKTASKSHLHEDKTHMPSVNDRLCGLVVKVPDYRSIGPGSIPCATKFSEK
jgi:hypothetical protein